ncbi:MAG TPA: hypothetical protein VF252_03425 [Gemmatimonadales bacterium]
MMHTFELVRRSTRLRTLLLAAFGLSLGACGDPDRITDATTDEAEPTASVEVAGADESGELGTLAITEEDGGIGEEEGDASLPSLSLNVSVGAVSQSNAFRGGIPFGAFHLPKSLYGTTYTGSLGNISPNQLIDYLETARRRGAKVMVTFSGNEKHFISRRLFSMALWKQRVNRYRHLNLASYIKDGTLIGHYLVDEPHDPANWGGRTIPLAAIDEMARYSKQLWPGLPTVARAWPKFLKGHNWRYLDAAWAQYSDRFGSVSAFMQQNVRDAKAAGLALVVGMNQLAGGSKSGLRGFYSGRFAMSANQLRSWGAAMLGDSYPCAFLSWAYNAKYMGRSDIRSAMAHLADKARSRPAKSCKGGKAATTAGGGPGPQGPSSPGGSGGGSSSIRLKVEGRTAGGRQHMKLTWSGVKGSTVDVYRDGSHLTITQNDGHYVNARRSIRGVTYAYKVCQKGSTVCSKTVKVSFR